jgi:hypothetical protein
MKTKRILNQIGVIFVTCLFMLISSQMAIAANQYILDGATGTYATTNCDSWATNRACNDLPLSLVRGDTYYIADGSYAKHVFNDAESGETYIYIKKATVSVHGTDSGWVNSYGDGQAIFTATGTTYQQALNFRTGYYIVDGIVGSGKDYSTYGFKVIPAVNTLSEQLIGIPNLGDKSFQVNNITISHVAIVNSGVGDGTKTRTGVYSLVADLALASYAITISNNYFSGGHTNMMIIRGHHWTVKDNYFADNWSSASAHGQQITAGVSDDLTFSGNTFINTTLYAISAHRYGVIGKINYRWLIYNNIMIGGGQTDATDMNAFVGNSTRSEVDNVLQWQVHHNTMINVDFTNASTGFVFPGTLSAVATDKSYAYNNIFYNSVSPRMDNYGYTVGAVVHDNNAYLKCTGTFNSANESAPQRDDSAADPFVNSANGDYRLKVGTLPINTGKTLVTKYLLDYNSVARPQGGAWDIGAYEYMPIQSTLFVSSVNGTVTSNPSGINCGSTCYANFDAEASVTLNALPNSGYTFTGWSGGGCSGTGTCAVNMASAQVVTANYATAASAVTYYLNVSKSITAAGTITASDGTINCGSTCKAYYSAGKKVTLTVSAKIGYKFSRWTGTCTGQGATCTVTMDASKNTKAYFAVTK